MKRKYTEEGLARKAKFEEIGYMRWNVLFNGEYIGEVHKQPRGTYKAISKTGRYIGSGITKKEARLFVALDFYGDENVIYED